MEKANVKRAPSADFEPTVALRERGAVPKPLKALARGMKAKKRHEVRVPIPPPLHFDGLFFIRHPPSILVPRPLVPRR